MAGIDCNHKGHKEHKEILSVQFVALFYFISDYSVTLCELRDLCGSSPRPVTGTEPVLGKAVYL